MLFKDIELYFNNNRSGKESYFCLKMNYLLIIARKIAS